MPARYTAARPAVSFGGLVVLLALAGVSCSQERRTAQEVDRLGDESEIRAVLAANDEARKRRYTDNATVLMVRTERGWKIAAVRVLGQVQP